ncbi:hypothetical protein IMF27_04835 [Pseudomonas sp. PCH199]|uniref:hypothetical protein n=1 Tax=unclassified Pseudomonas TaxID=196821 RepID=UPI000BCB2F03|nr:MULTISPECIES: hypothetical protein [unclassified Pseudomonas]MCW8275110.1 hypothetical protein [Pseudomonas sp. PCH199]PAM84781.1 hypothetical protein CES87_04930 [Pseudomonas sp. ERMR1:02]
MDVNENAPCLNDRIVWTFFASRLAPTGVRIHPRNQVGCQAASLLIWLLIFLRPGEAERRFSVGASLLAMDVNDNAACLSDRVVRDFIASKLRSYRLFQVTRKGETVSRRYRSNGYSPNPNTHLQPPNLKRTALPAIRASMLL